MRRACFRQSLLPLLVALPACVSLSPAYEAVDLSALSAPEDAGAVLIAERPVVEWWEGPGPPRDFMGGSRIKPHNSYRTGATEGLAGALIDAGYVVLDVSALRAALHDLARGQVDRESLAELAAAAADDLEPGIARCRAFNPKSVASDASLATAGLRGASSPSRRRPLTCMAELAAWLWERHVASMGVAWVVETANHHDIVYSGKNVLGGWSSKATSRTWAHAYKPGEPTMSVATAVGVNHPAAPLRALRGLGTRRARDVPVAMPERADAKNPALFAGKPVDVEVALRPADSERTLARDWSVRADGEAISLPEACAPVLPPHRFVPRKAPVAASLNTLWPSSSKLQPERCTLRAVRSVLGPDTLRYTLRCDGWEHDKVQLVSLTVDEGTVDLSTVVRAYALKLITPVCRRAYNNAARAARERERWKAAASRTPDEVRVAALAGQPLPPAYWLPPDLASELERYLALLAEGPGSTESASDAASTCALVEAAEGAKKSLDRHLSDVVDRHRASSLDEPMITQADAAAEAFTAALPGITVYRGEAMSAGALVNYRELSALDLPPAFKVAMEDPLLFGDKTGLAPHQIFMTDSQICTDLETLHDLLPASGRRYRQVPACLQALANRRLKGALDTASRGCFCDNKATVRRIAPTLIERLQPFDDLKQWNGKVRSVAVRAAIDDEASHFDGRCDF